MNIFSFKKCSWFKRPLLQSLIQRNKFAYEAEFCTKSNNLLPNYFSFITKIYITFWRKYLEFANLPTKLDFYWEKTAFSWGFGLAWLRFCWQDEATATHAQTCTSCSLLCGYYKTRWPVVFIITVPFKPAPQGLASMK